MGNLIYRKYSNLICFLLDVISKNDFMVITSPPILLGPLAQSVRAGDS